MEDKINNEGEIDLLTVWNSIVREKFLIIFFTLISTSSTILYTYLVKPIYSGSFNIIVQEESNNNSSSALESTMFLDIVGPSGNKNRTQEIILKSPLVLMPVFEYVKEYYKKNSIDKEYYSFSDWLEEALDVKFQNKSQILKVTYKSNDKSLIIDSLNLISQKYQDYSKRDREKTIVKTIEYLENQNEIMKEKSLISTKKLNEFSIENGLGNIDGFVDLNETSNSLGNLNNILNNNYKIPKSFGILNKPNVKSESNAGQRFKSQYNLLERYETQYIDLSSKLKPNSETLKYLKNKIDNLRSSLKRPNEILIQYKELLKISRRDSLLLEQIQQNLEIMKLEQVKSPDPWELISKPILDRGRIFPNRKLLTLIAFFASLLTSISLALFKQKRSNLIYEIKELERIITTNYLEKIYVNNISLSRDLIKKIIEQNINLEDEINSKLSIGISLYKNKYDDEFIENLISNTKNIQKVDITEKSSLKNQKKLILLIRDGISSNDLELLNKYIYINSNKIIGWLFIDTKTKFE